MLGCLLTSVIVLKSLKIIIVYYSLPSRHTLVVLSRREIDKGLARVALIVRRVAVITLHFI